MEITSRRVMQNTLAQLLFRGFMVVLSLVTTRYLTRQLGVGGYAQFGFFTAVTTFFYAFGDWGTQMVMIRDGAQTKKLGLYWWNAFWFRLVLVVFGYGLYLGYLLVTMKAGEQRLIFGWGGLILFLFSVKTTAQVHKDQFIPVDFSIRSKAS